MGQVDRASDPPGKLVFTNVPEYSLVDDLSGDPLPAPLVTLAKREEITEMYRERNGSVEKNGSAETNVDRWRKMDLSGKNIDL